MPEILVVGATGRTGREIALQLASAGVPVRALARKPENVRLPPSINVVYGDLTDPDSLDGSLTGIDSVFLVWTAPPPGFTPVVDRIARNARRIVFLSAPFKTPHPFFQQPHPASEIAARRDDVIEKSGLEWTILRPGMFSANATLWWAEQVRSGDLVRWPYLNAPTAPIDERDIAAVGVCALRENGHAGKDYVLTGPEQLTHAEQIETIGSVLGRSLRMEEMTRDEFRREFQPDFRAHDMLLDAWRAAIGLPAWITSSVEEVTGRPARTFREWVTDHKAAFVPASVR
jgi:uncharacterized protein YbjT (DUF2867 family)